LPIPAASGYIGPMSTGEFLPILRLSRHGALALGLLLRLAR
jgi:hypothetical protein